MNQIWVGSNVDLSCELNSSSVGKKVFIIPCCTDLQEDEVIMKSGTGTSRPSGIQILGRGCYLPQPSPNTPRECSGHMNNATPGGKCLCSQVSQFPHGSLSICVAGLQQEANYFRRLMFCGKASH